MSEHVVVNGGRTGAMGRIRNDFESTVFKGDDRNFAAVNGCIVLLPTQCLNYDVTIILRQTSFKIFE